MKRYINLFTSFLLLLLCGLSLAVNAADTFNYKTIVPASALPDEPSFIVVNLYVTVDDNVPVATQSFLPGEWQLSQDSNSKILQVSMGDVAHLDATPNLWAELEVDGEIIGSREAIAIIEPGLSVGGTIESRTEGFKFPDATVQTTAGISSGDLATHQADVSAHHSPLVTTTEIVDGTILPADVNNAQHFTVAGMTIDGGGGLQVYSHNDIRIFDDINGVRWFNAAGDTQMSNIVVSSGGTRFDDVTNGRSIFNSNTSGLGVGTSSPGSTHAVTIPSLEVTGNLEIGLTRVSASYNVDNTSTCHSHGDLTCYYGGGTVSCPVGTNVVGGGSTGSSARYGSVSATYPTSTTSWYCASSYDLSTSASCYAICARLE